VTQQKIELFYRLAMKLKYITRKMQNGLVDVFQTNYIKDIRILQSGKKKIME